MEKDFLHKINISKVLEETGLDMSGLSALLDIEEQTIGRWEKDKAHNGNRPKYNAIIMMLQKGATTKTLFGIDCNPQKELNKLLHAATRSAEARQREIYKRKIQKLSSKGKGNKRRHSDYYLGG